jgi:hypothetical protein
VVLHEAYTSTRPDASHDDGDDHDEDQGSQVTVESLFSEEERQRIINKAVESQVVNADDLSLILPSGHENSKGFDPRCFAYFVNIWQIAFMV